MNAILYSSKTTDEETKAMDYMQQGQDVDTEKTIPVWEKFTLSLTEAALYTGIGQHKLCELADNEDCDFILWVGRKRLFKRKKLEEYIEKAYSI